MQEQSVSYELGRWSATFRAPAIESQFRAEEVPSLGRPFTISLTLLALVFIGTFLLDYNWFIDRAPHVLWNLGISRGVAVAGAVLALVVVRRWPSWPVFTLTGLAAIALASGAYLYLSLVQVPFIDRSDSPIWYAAITIFALAGFPVPVRWVLVYALFPLAASALYLVGVHETPLFEVPRLVALQLTFLAGGLVLAQRENQARRRQFLLLRRQREINQRLTSEVAERKRIEARLSDRTDQLELRLAQTQRLEAIALLAGGIAHDFNNLLMPIMGYAELAQHRAGPDGPVSGYLVQIQHAAERARDMTRQLLAFGRKQLLDVRHVDLGALIRDLEGVLRRLLREDIVLEVELEPGLGPVLADPSQIEQIMLNLVVNARDAMPGGGRMRIATAGATAADLARAGLEPVEGAGEQFVGVSVTDDGVGMDGATIDRVFEPFFTTKDTGQGTGLGLAMVHGIVSQHRGRIGVTSAPGQGTRVEFFLPVSGMRADSIAPEEPRVVELAGNETVLLVEDDEMVRDFVGRVLGSYGYHVLVTGDGQEALDLAARFADPIHLLVTDVVMPKLSGPELWRELRRLRPTLRVLYISGYPDDELGPHGVLTEGIQFLAKPFKVQQLAEKVREALLHG